MTSNQQPGRDRNRLGAVAMIAVFDLAGPLVAYSLLRSAGQSTVSALVLSGIFPAVGVLAGLIRHRRMDAVGILVLAGIADNVLLADPNDVLGVDCLFSDHKDIAAVILEITNQKKSEAALIQSAIV